jgi:hypothetical protein
MDALAASEVEHRVSNVIALPALNAARRSSMERAGCSQLVGTSECAPKQPCLDVAGSLLPVAASRSTISTTLRRNLTSEILENAPTRDCPSRVPRTSRNALGVRSSPIPAGSQPPGAPSKKWAAGTSRILPTCWSRLAPIRRRDRLTARHHRDVLGKSLPGARLLKRPMSLPWVANLIGRTNSLVWIFIYRPEFGLAVWWGLVWCPRRGLVCCAEPSRERYFKRSGRSKSCFGF